MSPSLAALVAALRKEGFPALADEISINEHNSHRYIAMRWAYTEDTRSDWLITFPEYDTAADKCVHRYEQGKN